MPVTASRPGPGLERRETGVGEEVT